MKKTSYPQTRTPEENSKNKVVTMKNLQEIYKNQLAFS